MLLSSQFYRREVCIVARELIGCVLQTDAAEGMTSGLIVETEAYHQSEPASHSYCGETQRNAAMFEWGGVAYVYRSYGVHWCMNVVVGDLGEGAAVLIRALEPLEGLALMRQRRGLGGDAALATGPGNLCKAMGITSEHNGRSLRSRNLRIFAGLHGDVDIRATPRIGISKATRKPWRFVWRGHDCVSGPKRLR